MKDLIKIKPREQVGAATYNKYKFQIAAAIEILIELMKTGGDFWLLMDYLEDVVVIEDYDKEQSIISFYQVKSKEKNSITIGNVISEKFFNKMHYNISSFRDHECNSTLLTNCGINFNSSVVNDTIKVNLADYLNTVVNTGNDEKDKKENEFRESKKKEIIASIARTEGIEESEVNLSKFFLLTTTLTLADYDRQITGAFTDYIKEAEPNLTATSVDTIKDKVWKDLESKNKHVISGNAIDEKTIVSNKGITRKGFIDIMNIQKFVQFPSYNDFSNFCSEYGSSFGTTPVKDKQRYMEFQTNCIVDERKTLTLIYELFNEVEESFIELPKEDLLDSLDNIVKEDSRVTNLKLYDKYKDIFHALYLYKKLED